MQGGPGFFRQSDIAVLEKTATMLGLLVDIRTLYLLMCMQLLEHQAGSDDAMKNEPSVGRHGDISQK